ncbi:hypothetical protein FO519_001173 [Halicephalobus sp. NKZ332]|nr:hypothetical protein FO519_001173 [Halicephalobus sp. NKZ332]
MFGNKTFGTTTTSTSLFGSTSNTSGFGFGSTMVDAGPEGSTIPFEPTRGTDTMVRNGDSKDISTKHMCITAMERYKARSLEELRVFDYAANRKGPQAGGSAFGQPSATGGGGLFGQNKPSMFGSAQPSGFGSTATTSSSPFGGSAFGQANKPAFGTSSTSSGLFGSNQNTSTTGGGSLFGQSGTSAFGQSNTTSSGIFGNKPAFGSTGASQTQSSLFGKPATSGVFGQPASTSSGFGFGAPTTTASSVFSSPFGSTTTTTASNPFGAKPASTGFGGFGAAPTGAASGSLFGNTTQTSTAGGLFGGAAAKPAGTGLFGSQPATGATPFGGGATTGGLFGATNKPATGGLFGNTSTLGFGSQPAAQPAPAVISQPASPPIILGGNIDEASLQRKLIEAQLSTMPYGDSPLLKGRITSTGSSPNASLTKSEDPEIQSRLRKLATQAIVGCDTSASFNNGTPITKLNNETLRSATSSPHSNLSYKPLVPLPALSFAPNERSSLNLSLRRSPPKIAPAKNALLNSSSNMMSPRSFDPSLLKIKNNGSLLNIESTGKSRQNGQTPTSPTSPSPATPDERRRSVVFAEGPELEKVSEIRPVRLDFDTSLNDSINLNKTSSGTPQQPLKSILVTAESRQKKDQQRQGVNSTSPVSPGALSSSQSDSITHGLESPLNRSNASLSTDNGYFTEPSLDLLESMMRDGKVNIKDGLTIGRIGYGSVFWPGGFELSTLDFEKIVVFRSKEVTVYPDETVKPPVGVDLNRPAEISLERVWPYDKETQEYIKDPVAMGKLRFRNRLELVCQRMDAKFIDYKLNTGTWTFSVRHFSKYGLMDDDEELTEADLQALLKNQEQLSRVQRAKIIRKSPLKEIQSSFSSSSAFFRKGLGGVLDSPVVKVERMEYEVDMSDDPFESDLKRIKLDTDIFDAIDSKILPSHKDESYVPQKMVQRRTANKGVVEVSHEKELQWLMRKIHGKTPTILPNNPRIQWHPSNPAFCIKGDRLQRHVDLYRVNIVPMLKDYFLNILTNDGRAGEFDRIGQTEALKFSPPSALLQLLDSYLLFVKRNPNLDQSKIDVEIEQLFRALLVSPNTPNFAVEQRIRMSNWIKDKLQPELKKVLDRFSYEDNSSGTRMIFECLVHGNVREGVKIAQKLQMYNLALLMSLYKCPNSSRCKQSFADQHYDSNRIFRNANKDEYLMKIYQLLAGPKDSKGNTRGDDFFECLKGLSWFQVVGVFLWYASTPSDGLAGWADFYRELSSSEKLSVVM